MNRLVVVSGQSALLPNFPGELLGNWHVLHTKPRQEKILARDLALMGIGCFLPLHHEPKMHGRHKVVIEEPVFPGYLFLRGSLDDVYSADRTRRVVRPLHVADQEKLDWALRNLHVALTHGARLDPYPCLKRGVRVEVRTGPFAGLQGVIEERLSADRLVLQVDVLGRATSLELDGALVERID